MARAFRVDEVIPPMLQEELLRLARLDRDWLRVKHLGHPPGKMGWGEYQAKCQYVSWITKLWQSGADAFGMWASSIWLLDGPKLFRPSLEQCRAMENIDVNLTLGDYSQPYPALYVDVPPGLYPPFTGGLAFVAPGQDFLSVTLMGLPGHEHDITTTVCRIAQDRERLIEESLTRYDPDCADLGATAALLLRVALNSCLALSAYGCHMDYLLPKEVERDRSMAGEQTERGQRARARLKMAVREVAFDQEVRLHRSTGGGEATGDGTPKRAHWRRGHWHTVAHGPQKTLRKRVLYPPVFVHGDQFGGDPAKLVTTYR